MTTLQRLNAVKRQKTEKQDSLGAFIAGRAQALGKISETELQITQLGEDRRSESSKEFEVEGKVVSVAPDAVKDAMNGSLYYPVQISPDEDSLHRGGSMSLYPDMRAEVFIEIAERSVVSYFAKPLTDQLKHTFREA